MRMKGNEIYNTNFTYLVSVNFLLPCKEINGIQFLRHLLTLSYFDLLKQWVLNLLVLTPFGNF